ncbi:hypothetical protein ABZ383_26485 [Streptomyces sp. NPDC005900]|uniref:hypothetical protein n=1 Tax=Streptomyces sp. NPDC005900 TaxID=3154569 RepID=UPI0034060CC6
MTSITNRKPGICTGVDCGRYVPPGEGTANRTGQGAWVVRCAEHPVSEPPPEALIRQRIEDVADARPAQVRFTGSRTECTALAEALKQAVGITVLHVSEPEPRRAPDDDRMSVYARVRVDPRALAAIAREEDIR